MKIHKITKDQLDIDNNYVGEVDLTNFHGAIEAEKNLGWVKFKSLKANFYIKFDAGSGIKAGWGIEAGSGIKAGWGIEAGDGIKAGDGIEAGDGIKAGGGIKAGDGIEAGFSITAKWISVKLRIFAGICLWKVPEPDEQKIVLEELRQGTICFGELVIKEKRRIGL